MNDSKRDIREKILISTTTFPLNSNDNQPRFIFDLAKFLTPYFKPIISAPRGLDAKKVEFNNGLIIHRYPYFIKRYEKLAYGSGILENLKLSRWRYLLIPFFLLAQFFSSIVIINKYKIRVINAHWIIPQGIVAVLVKKVFRGKIKVIITSHGSDLFSLNNSLLNKLKKWTIEQSDSLIVVSSTMKSFCEKELLISKVTPIYVRSMGINVSEQFVAVRKMKQRKGIIFVGRLIRSKGVSVLLNSLAILEDKGLSVRLEVVGSGPELYNLRKESKSLGLSNQVRFIGALPNSEVPGKLNENKILVLPSYSEGFGLVVGEAMACGCVVVVSDLPAVKDIVTDGINGLTFPAGNALALSDKLEYLLKNESQMARLSKNAENSVREKLGWLNVAKEYGRIVSDTLGE